MIAYVAIAGVIILFIWWHFRPQSTNSNFHIIVDNSNIFIGAQNISSAKQDASVRVNVKKLSKVIEKEKSSSNIKTRIVGGSMPPKGARVWTEWEARGYTCFLGDRSFNNKEVFLDDMLHSQMLHRVLTQRSDQNTRQVLVLVTGDGNGNENRTTFPGVVQEALNHNWKVEVWSWESCLSKKFKEIQRRVPKDMEIYYLDDHRDQITFV